MSIELIGGDVQAEAIIALQILNDTNRGLLICTIRYEYPEDLHFTSVTITANGKEYVFDNVLASYSESRKANHISPYLHGPSCDIIGALLDTNTEVHYVLHGDKTIGGRMEIINYKSQLQSLYDDYIANGGKSQDLSEFAKEYPILITNLTDHSVIYDSSTSTSIGSSGSTSSKASGNNSTKTDWLNYYKQHNINYVIVPADVLYEYGSAYTDLTVVTAITIESASTGMLQANTPNNDTYSFSITADFKDRDEIKGLSKGDTCIISGVVEAMNPINFLGSGKSVRMNDCHIITGSISKSDIEAARQAQVQFANNRLTEVAQAKAQAIEE